MLRCFIAEFRDPVSASSSPRGWLCLWRTHSAGPRWPVPLVEPLRARFRDAVACYLKFCGGASIAFPPRTRGTDVAHTHHMAPGAAALGTRHAARIWTL